MATNAQDWSVQNVIGITVMVGSTDAVGVFSLQTLTISEFGRMQERVLTENGEGLQLGRGDASICSVYPAVTPYEVVEYAEHIRLTPHELFPNKKNFL